MRLNYIFIGIIVIMGIAIIGCTTQIDINKQIDDQKNDVNSSISEQQEKLDEQNNKYVDDTKTELKPEVDEEMLVCNQDSDCVETTLGCCPCSNGGKNIAINKNFVDEWVAGIGDCKNIMCVAVVLCNVRKSPFCELGKCVMKEVFYYDKTEDYCDSLQDSGARDRCYYDVGITRADLQICEKISTNTKSGCKYFVSVKSNNISQCNENIHCISDIAVNLNDFSICHKIREIPIGQENPYVTFWCITKVAVSLSNESICNEVDNIEGLIEKTRNPSFNIGYCVGYVNGTYSLS